MQDFRGALPGEAEATYTSEIGYRWISRAVTTPLAVTLFVESPSFRPYQPIPPPSE